MAIEQRRPQPGLTFHTDRGSQYTSSAFAKLLADNQVRQSLSRPGQCWDNAVAESFFSTLKRAHLPRSDVLAQHRTSGDLGVHRGLLQPTAFALLARLR